MKSKFNKKFLSLLSPTFFLVMTFCIFMPSSLFLGNINEFAVDYTDILPIITVVTLAAAAIIFIVGVVVFFISKKAFDVYVLLVFGVALGFYVQGNFLNPSFDALNGTAIDWSDYTTSSVISIAVWLVCIAVPQVVAHLKKDIMNMVCRWGSYFLAAVQLCTLVVLVLTTTRAVETDFILTKKGQFELSKNDNIVMFIVDTLDAEWAERDITNNPHYAGNLKDFTYFDNTVAGGAPTVLGVPILLTGYEYDTTITLDEYYRKAYEKSSFLEDINNSKYDIKLYTDYSYLNGADKSNVYNAEEEQIYAISSNMEFAKYLYKLAGFYAMPMPVKRFFWFYGDDFSKLIKAEDANKEVYTCNDPQFYSDFKDKGLKAENKRNLFVLYHLFGVHGPYSMNENAQKVSEDDTDQTRQIQGTLKIIFEYIDEMKRLGVYDNSTIIITADHGGVDIYQNPAVFIKQKGESRNQMAVNSDPVTFRNLQSTIAATAMDDASAYGPTMYQMAGNKDVRYHVSPQVLNEVYFPDNEFVILRDYCVFKIEGNPRDMKNVSVVTDEEEMRKINEKYEE